MKKFCIYGKGGIGKSTTVANVAAALAAERKKVAVVGCDPKADSTRCLMGRRIPSVLHQMYQEPPGEIAFRGFGDILCIESGGPQPGTGCAGRGIVTALEEIRKRDLFRDCEVVIYDVLGDGVCGGFSMPLREEVADVVYLVTTSDFMSLYAANNICRGIEKYARTGHIRLAGIIHNGRSSRDVPEYVHTLAQRLGTQVVGRIPMSTLIADAELQRKTVIEAFPDSDIAGSFRVLADRILAGGPRCIPAPMTDEELEQLWGI